MTARLSQCRRFGYAAPNQTKIRWGRDRPMNRRELLKATAALPLACAGLCTPAFAVGNWPDRTINMIVPFPAGGQADLAARPVALALEEVLGRPFIVDNRAGGAGGSGGQWAAAGGA